MALEFGALIDLHLHLDGSISLQSARQLARMQGIPVPDGEALVKAMTVGPECRNLNDFLEKFAFPCSLLQTEEAITLAVRNLLCELAGQGLIYAEIRFAPQLFTDKGLSMEKVVEAAIAGLDDSILPCGLILCCMRGPSDKVEKQNYQTIELTSEYLGRGVVASDLAGAEALFPTADYYQLFSFAGKSGVPFEIHAGEAQGNVSGLDSIRAALDMGASRIGHGVLSYTSDALVKELSRRKVPLTLCPTSNLCTCVFDNISQYPYRQFMEAGVKFCLNTDDMTVEGINLRHEYELIRSAFGMTASDASLLLNNAVDMSFAPESLKKTLRALIADHYGQCQ